MFGVLMKHEVKQTFRPLLVMLGTVVAVVATCTVFLMLKLPIVSELALAIAAIALASFPFVVLGYAAVRYYQSLYGRIGYFTMTIPAKGRTLFWVKATWAFVIGLLAYAVLAIGLVVVAMAKDGLTLGAIIDSVSAGVGWRFIGIVVALVVVQLVSTIAIGALVVSLGMSARFNHMGMGGMVLVGVIAYFATQGLVLAGMLLIPLGVRIDPTGVGQIVYEGSLPSIMSSLRGGMDLPVLGLGALMAFIALGVAAAIWTIRLIERHTALR